MVHQIQKVLIGMPLILHGDELAVFYGAFSAGFYYLHENYGGIWARQNDSVQWSGLYSSQL